eukprot:gene26792-4382_t
MTGVQAFPSHLPILQLANRVILPHTYARVEVPRGGASSTAFLEECLSAHVPPPLVAVLTVVGKASDNDQDGGEMSLPVDADGRAIGTAAKIVQVSRLLQAGHFVIVLEGLGRVAVENAPALHLESQEPFDRIKVIQLEEMAGYTSQDTPGAQALHDDPKDSVQLQALGAEVKSTMAAFVKVVARKTGAAKRMLQTIEKLPPWQAADVVGAALSSTVDDRLQVLHTISHMDRLQLARKLARRSLQLAKSGNNSAPSTANKLSTTRSRPPISSGSTVRGPPDGASTGSTGGPGSGGSQLVRGADEGEAQPSYLASRAYVEVLAELPWKQTSSSLTAAAKIGKGIASDSADGRVMPLAEARTLLDRQHYGLTKIKDRVVEYLAVLRLKGTSARAPILCFIGPPGVGKTSLAHSVAKVLRRPFVRIALGGVRDEAEGLRHAGVSDPVMLLDEVDKLGKDSVRGDPASALLEVLDPEQNQNFTDTYLGHPFDLSQVTFVATANRAADIPPALLDRLEVIQLTGYTLDEKVHIARVHLMPRLLLEHGLATPDGGVNFPDAVLSHVAEGYTREAGVRSLSRCLAAICRHLAVSIVAESDERGSTDMMTSSHSETAENQSSVELQSTRGTKLSQAQLGGGTGGRIRLSPLQLQSTHSTQPSQT